MLLRPTNGARQSDRDDTHAVRELLTAAKGRVHVWLVSEKTQPAQR